MRRARCEIGHEVMVQFDDKDCPECHAPIVALGSKPKHDAVVDLRSLDPKYDEGDPSANW